jgi:predicted GIY-YIG superfamily endonuclease
MWGRPKSNSKYSFVYILRDLYHPNRFKIGMSDDPDRRAKQEDYRLYRKKDGLPAAIEVIADWDFLTARAAHYVEQSIIDLLRRQKYKEIDKKYNWFEIDHESLDFFLQGLKSFIAETQKNAGDVFFASEARRKDKPYGKHFQKWLESLKDSVGGDA